MSLPNYQIVVLDTSGSVRRIYDTATFYELTYSRVYNGVGRFAVTFPANAVPDDTFTLDCFVEIYRESPATSELTREQTYLTRVLHRYREDDVDKFTAGGVSLEHLLARRIIDPSDDPAAAGGGYSTKAGPADAVIREYVREQAGPLSSAARRIPNFDVVPVAGIGEGVGDRLRFENLLDVVQKLATRAEIGFVVERISGNQLEMRVGLLTTDRRVDTNYPFTASTLFDPKRGNLRDPSLRIDAIDQKNYLYLQGQGQGSNRIVLQFPGNGLIDSPYNRLEFVSDARNIEKGSASGLITQGAALLQENLPKTEFDFEIDGTTPGATYRLDFDVGDLVTGQWDEFTEDLRITSVEIALNAGGESLTISTEKYEPA